MKIKSWGRFLPAQIPVQQKNIERPSYGIAKNILYPIDNVSPVALSTLSLICCISYLKCKPAHVLVKRIMLTFFLISYIFAVTIFEMGFSRDYQLETGGRLLKIGDQFMHYLSRDIKGTLDSKKNYVANFWHGFGANSLSWRPLIDIWNETNNSSHNITVVSHDIPGFGFNIRGERNSQLYRPMWNAECGLLLSGYEHRDGDIDENTREKSSVESSAGSEYEHLLVGHSMGCSAAIIAAAVLVNKYIQCNATTHPRVCLVLEAPAIISANITISTNDTSRVNSILAQVSSAAAASFPLVTSDEAKGPSAGAAIPPCIALTSFESRRLRTVSSLLPRLVQLGRTYVLRVLMFPLRLCLRCLLCTEYFWRLGLGLAWGAASSTISLATIDSYRLPATAHGFDWDLLRFVLAQFSQRNSFATIATTPDGNATAVTTAAAQPNLPSPKQCEILSDSSDRVGMEISESYCTFPSTMVLPGVSKVQIISALGLTCYRANRL